MLHEFLTIHRAELVERCRRKAVARFAPKATEAELAHGIPFFLGQLIKTLQVEQTSEPMHSRKVSGPSGGHSESSEIGVTATLHGRELLEHGFTVDQVVHAYGDLCQAITDLAFERDAPIEVDEFRTLNRCLDNGIADAVTEFASKRDSLISAQGVQAMNERLGFLAHELRNLVQTATLAVSAIKVGNFGLRGATGAVLDRSLIGLRNLIDRSLSDVRVTAGMAPRPQRISLADFVTEMTISSSLEARAQGCRFSACDVENDLAVYADRDMLFAAVGNLLQNAFKFTAHHSEVALNVFAAGDRVLINVEDHCGGLSPGIAEKMFLPFAQSREDKSGLGLGLSICRRSVEANNGVMRVRDVPASGCVFTIDLPRHLA